MFAMVRYFGELDVQLIPSKMRYQAMHAVLYKLGLNAAKEVVNRENGMAFPVMYSYWLYYNANADQGYYAHFYVNHDLWVKYNNRHMTKG